MERLKICFRLVEINLQLQQKGRKVDPSEEHHTSCFRRNEKRSEPRDRAGERHLEKRGRQDGSVQQDDKKQIGGSEDEKKGEKMTIMIFIKIGFNNHKPNYHKNNINHSLTPKNKY